MANTYNSNSPAPANDFYTGLYFMTKEVFVTRDAKEAAERILTHAWVVIHAAIQGDDVLWVLGRI